MDIFNVLSIDWHVVGFFGRNDPWLGPFFLSHLEYNACRYTTYCSQGFQQNKNMNLRAQLALGGTKIYRVHLNSHRLMRIAFSQSKKS